MNKVSPKVKDKNNQALPLIFLAWLVYTSSYFGKVNYSANITQIIDFYGITKAEAGIVPTFFFFAYGLGQVFNGLFCKKYNVKWMVFGSLLVSAVINLVIAVSTEFSFIKWLWLVNGFVLSILWPSLIRTLSENVPQKSLALSSVVIGTTVATGTLIIYGLSSIYAAFDKFKLAFYTAGFAVIVVAVLWVLLYNRATTSAREEKDEEGYTDDVRSDASSSEKQEIKERKLLFASIGVLCFCAIGVNLIKDGLTTWVPSILKDEFNMSDSISILLTLFLPILAVFGNACALWVHKRIPDYINHCAIVFAVIAILIGGIITSLGCGWASTMLAGLVGANFLASSLNSLITSIFPMFMRGKVNSGMLAGILNAFCYIGSTISSYGLGAIADNFGWTVVFYTLIAFCLVALSVWAGYSTWKAFLKKKI